MKELLRALPNLARLLARLVADPVLPRAAKVALAAALVYLASPFDLIPDFIPVVGYLDDLLVAALVVDGVLNWVDRGLVLRYWPGTPDSLDLMVAINYAVMATDLVVDGTFGRLTALRDGNYANVPLAVLGQGVKRVDVDALYDEGSYRPKIRHVDGKPMFLN